MRRVFLLSPANCGGRRAAMLRRPGARAELAARLRSPQGAPLGEVFAFMSGLYFRGKLAYARRFADPVDLPGEPDSFASGVFVITPGAGLRTPETPLTLDAIDRFASIAIDADNAAYRDPLVASASALARTLDDEVVVVLLGSIASPKYVDVLAGVLGERLYFPVDFVGRGDMSRGGLMLRRAASGVELEYAKVAGAVRRGTRPPRLDPPARVTSG